MVRCKRQLCHNGNVISDEKQCFWIEIETVIFYVNLLI